jgi:hypothetical protein
LEGLKGAPGNITQLVDDLMQELEKLDAVPKK